MPIPESPHPRSETPHPRSETPHPRSESRDAPAPGAEAQALFAVLYEDLRGIARRQLGPGDTINTTALVHELFLRMAAGESPAFVDQRQFFVYAARAMRHLLVDRARHRLREKSGGGRVHVELDAPGADSVTIDAREALELDDALRRLEAEDPRAAQVVELHYFGGLELGRIAELLGVVRRTVDRDLRYARAYLKSNC